MACTLASLRETASPLTTRFISVLNCYAVFAPHCSLSFGSIVKKTMFLFETIFPEGSCDRGAILRLQ